MHRKWNRTLVEKIRESLASVLPITGIVLLLSITIVPLSAGTMVMFLFGALMLILGMGLFTMGVDISMMPMGEGIGVSISKSHRLWVSLLICFVLGMLITIAEPDLQLLGRQVPSIPASVLIVCVAIGVGLFLAISLLHMLFSIKLSVLLLISYGIALVLAIFTPNNFIPIAFDSGGVTTGPITVPFIMAMGIGLASLRSDKNSQSDAFGLIALCSIGSVLAVLLLGIFYTPTEAAGAVVKLPQVVSTKDAAMNFIHAFPEYFREVAAAIIPLLVVFIVYQCITHRFHRSQMNRIMVGMLYTFLGLVFFLTGVNEGFMSAGFLIGHAIAGSAHSWILVPIGALIGYFIVSAEPAVHVLNKQVEEISSGRITEKQMSRALSIGVSLSVGLAMLRILTGIPLHSFLIPGYAIALIMSFFTSQMFTGVAFDSGGVASGPMTAAFLSPLAMGACEAVGGNILTEAFGIVAMVAMTPLVTIQLLELYNRIKRHHIPATAAHARFENTVQYYD